MSDARIVKHPLLGALPVYKQVRFTFEASEYEGYEGEPVAAALLANDVRILRYTRDKKPRGAYCFIGHCFECRITIDGRSNQRSCLVPLREGMEIFRGDW